MHALVVDYLLFCCWGEKKREQSGRVPAGYLCGKEGTIGYIVGSEGCLVVAMPGGGETIHYVMIRTGRQWCWWTVKVSPRFSMIFSSGFLSPNM